MISNIYYNRLGLKAKELTRVYNNRWLEVEGEYEWARKLKLYYYTRQRLDSIVTMSAPRLYDMKTTYDNTGRPDSVFRDNEFLYKYDNYTCAEVEALKRKYSNNNWLQAINVP